MTLRAYLITLRGRIREALCPELQMLRDQNRSLRADYQQIVAQRNYWMARAERLQSIVQGKIVVRKVWWDEAGDIQWELADISKERNDD
jgi:hypothetical protein